MNMRIGKRENVYEYLQYALSEGVMEGCILGDNDIFWIVLLCSNTRQSTSDVVGE